MSGGSLDYGYSKIDILADDIEVIFINDGKYMDEDYSSELEFPYYRTTRKQIEYDRLEGASDAQRNEILEEVRSLINDLRLCAKRAKEIELFLSHDTGVESYLERLNNINLKG